MLTRAWRHTIRRYNSAFARGVPAEASKSLLHTFDVFDTLLTRIWFRPTDALLHAGMECERARLMHSSAEDYCQRREGVEASLRRRYPAREITLTEIYADLAREFAWSAEQMTRAMKIELECERQACRPIEPVARRLRAVLTGSGRVACISDFYAPGAFLLELLAKAGVALEYQDVIVSCDEQVTKRSGRLFSLAASRYRIPPALIVHTGDHPVSDVIQARKAGFSVEPYVRGAPLSSERVLASCGLGARERLISSAIAGAARRARLDRETRGSAEVLSNVATAVAGPLLFGYVLWLLTQAHQRGIRRLYFLSRDGQILWRVAREIDRSLGLNIELRYLHASRRAWFLASTALGTARDRIAAITSDGTIAIADLLARLAIEPGQARKVLEDAGFPQAMWTRQIGSDDLHPLRTIFAQAPLDRLVSVRAAPERELCIDYLMSQGVLDGTPSAIVDVGWKGRLQAAMTRLLRTMGGKHQTGFYLALRERPSATEIGPTHVYAQEADATALNPTLTEVFCAADHGTVLGYQRLADGHVVPVLAEGQEPLLEWGVQAFQDGVIAFATKMIDAMEVLDEQPELVITILRQSGLLAVRRFVRQPSRAEAAIFGAFPHDAGQSHAYASDLAPEVPARILMGALVRPRLLNERTHWQQGSIVRSSRLGCLALALWTARVEGIPRLKKSLSRPVAR